MVLNLVKAMNIDEISREISYGATLTPLGFYRSNKSMMFSLDYLGNPERLYVVDAQYCMILERYSDDINGRIRRLQYDRNFSVDFDLCVNL